MRENGFLYETLAGLGGDVVLFLRVLCVLRVYAFAFLGVLGVSAVQVLNYLRVSAANNKAKPLRGFRFTAGTASSKF